MVRNVFTYSPEASLDFTLELSDEMPEGASIREFLKFSGTIPLKNLEQMKQAIEESCEQVYASEW